MPEKSTESSTARDTALERLAELYADFLAVEKGLSRLTIKAYIADLRDYFSKLLGNLPSMHTSQKSEIDEMCDMIELSHQMKVMWYSNFVILEDWL